MLKKLLKQLVSRRLRLVLFILFIGFAISHSASNAEQMDASLFLKKIDEVYAERDQAGALKKGESLCDQALTTDLPKDEVYWRFSRFKAWQGFLSQDRAFKLTFFKEAESLAKKAIEINPQSTEGHFWLGVAYGRIGETQGVLKSLFLIEPIRHEMDEVLKLNPNHPGAHHVLGVMYHKLPWFKGGSDKKSVEELQKSISLNGTNTLYHLDLAKTYLAMNREEDARKELETVLAIATPFDPVMAVLNKKEAHALLGK
ncbi:MAG: tetratricopeptide repeat protein [Nitrospiria bacterium]